MVDKSCSCTSNYCHECNRSDEARTAKYISRILRLLEHFYFYILHFVACVECGKDVMSYFPSSLSYSNTFLVIYNFSKTTDLSDFTGPIELPALNCRGCIKEQPTHHLCLGGKGGAVVRAPRPPTNVTCARGGGCFLTRG